MKNDKDPAHYRTGGKGGEAYLWEMSESVSLLLRSATRGENSALLDSGSTEH